MTPTAKPKVRNKPKVKRNPKQKSAVSAPVKTTIDKIALKIQKRVAQMIKNKTIPKRRLA